MKKVTQSSDLEVFDEDEDEDVARALREVWLAWLVQNRAKLSEGLVKSGACELPLHSSRYQLV